MGRDNKQKLELAKKMAEKINARKGDGKQSESQATAEAVMKGLAVKPAAAPTVSNKLLADQIAAKLNAKLGHVPMDRNETEQQAQVRNHKYFQKLQIFVLGPLILRIPLTIGILRIPLTIGILRIPLTIEILRIPPTIRI